MQCPPDIIRLDLFVLTCWLLYVQFKPRAMNFQALFIYISYIFRHYCLLCKFEEKTVRQVYFIFVRDHWFLDKLSLLFDRSPINYRVVDISRKHSYSLQYDVNRCQCDAIQQPGFAYWLSNFAFFPKSSKCKRLI